MDRRTGLRDLGVGIAITIGIPFPGCVGLSTSGNASGDVHGTLAEMTDDNRFEPDVVTIPAGETVAWRTVEYAPHTVTAYEDQLPPEAAYFTSCGFTNEAAARNRASEGDGILHRGEEYAHTFDVPGAYAYYCFPHKQARMTGTITVEPMEESGQGGT